MGTYLQKMMEFPGFGLHFDSDANPFFRSMVLEDMRRIASKPIGQQLLADIAAARPRSRTVTNGSEDLRAITFPDGVNVMITPTSIQYIQSGYKAAFTGSGMDKTLVASNHPAHNLAGCASYPVGGSQALAGNTMAAGDGSGSVSVMRYTNAQVLTSKGETTHSFIVLAHELIHSLHHVTGTRKDDVEEQWTSGLGMFRDEPMSENKVRAAFGLPPRTAY
jgi:hypothetical protein